ncbi:MAG TPA: hypothetical protein VM223_19255, partial [Planctomycetota bacterium]|nr:hypothetical protein [Planctomycetota bacterium]
KQEKSSAVLHILVGRTLSRLGRRQADQIVNTAKTIFDRGRLSAGQWDSRVACAELFLDAYVVLDHDQAKRVLFEMIAKPVEYSAEVARLLWRLGNVIRASETEDDAVSAARTKRSWEVMNRICGAASSRLKTLMGRYRDVPSESIPKRKVEQWRSLSFMVQGAARQLHAAVEDRNRDGQGWKDIPPTCRQRFYDNSKPLVQRLGDTGVVPVAHELIEFLAECLEMDPKGVFLQIGRIIVNAEGAGYQNESLADRLVVGIVERYLGEFRGVLAGDSECKEMLIKILDTFVGWKDAMTLTYRMGELWR